ncbi:VOC family protein [Sulfitobacter sp. TSTF-M16]|uniref:VOC family protein n=1 Tax=Sulfitobacter aestuariivivens TaxID=2766981 RepID=A0A927D3K1_9RHOB|nr:VOC family protein [Sulfitobacter aestuariivivens]MBD3662702.1 VOC family protein [Sulfitobacter aestuariivivens]
MELDHIAISALTRAAATAHVEDTLGVSLQQGGEHAVFHTHNMLLGLEDGLYLEAISTNPDAPRPGRPRWFDLDRFDGPPRFSNWICRCADLEATLSVLPDAFGKPVSLQRGDLRWRMAVPANGILPFDGCAPALMQWDGDAHPAARLTPSRCRLTALQVAHPEAEALAMLLAPHLQDARVSFDSGPARLVARFDTPTGERVLV